MKTLELYSVGNYVKVGPSKHKGKITAICIRSNDTVTYEVVWWDENGRLCDWLYTHEFELDTEFINNKKTIGFK